MAEKRPFLNRHAIFVHVSRDTYSDENHKTHSGKQAHMQEIFLSRLALD